MERLAQRQDGAGAGCGCTFPAEGAWEYLRRKRQLVVAIARTLCSWLSALLRQCSVRACSDHSAVPVQLGHTSYLSLSSYDHHRNPPCTCKMLRQELQLVSHAQV